LCRIWSLFGRPSPFKAITRLLVIKEFKFYLFNSHPFFFVSLIYPPFLSSYKRGYNLILGKHFVRGEKEKEDPL
jgi:hypothetical protein